MIEACRRRLPRAYGAWTLERWESGVGVSTEHAFNKMASRWGARMDGGVNKRDG